jgi:hypothetical protein
LAFKITELGRCLYVRDEVIGKLIVRCCIPGEEMVPGELCDWTGTLEQRSCRKCPFKWKHCPHLGCGKVLPVIVFKDHLENCERRSVTCDSCQISIPFCELAPHERNECPERPVTCICGFDVPFRLVDEHKRNECILTLFDCPLFALNCCSEGCSRKVDGCSINKDNQRDSETIPDLLPTSWRQAARRPNEN